MSLSDLAEFWRQQLVGREVKGEVVDPQTGATESYHLRCTAVSWSGFGDRIGIVWDNQITGGYVYIERTEDDLAGKTAESEARMLEAEVQAQTAEELNRRQYESLIGQEL